MPQFCWNVFGGRENAHAPARLPSGDATRSEPVGSKHDSTNHAGCSSSSACATLSAGFVRRSASRPKRNCPQPCRQAGERIVRVKRDGGHRVSARIVPVTAKPGSLFETASPLPLTRPHNSGRTACSGRLPAHGHRCWRRRMRRWIAERWDCPRGAKRSGAERSGAERSPRERQRPSQLLWNWRSSAAPALTFPSTAS